jgi:hypothetical protein
MRNARARAALAALPGRPPARGPERSPARAALRVAEAAAARSRVSRRAAAVADCSSWVDGFAWPEAASCPMRQRLVQRAARASAGAAVDASRAPSPRAERPVRPAAEAVEVLRAVAPEVVADLEEVGSTVRLLHPAQARADSSPDSQSSHGRHKPEIWQAQRVSGANKYRSTLLSGTNGISASL